MQIIEDKVYAFSKDNPPCYTAQPGEVLQFNTLDCFSGRLTDETVTMKDMDFSYNITNPAAGPVYVEGAEVGDVLVVDIYDIQVADEGTIATDDHWRASVRGHRLPHEEDQDRGRHGRLQRACASPSTP